jgi:methionyl-tRNA formyltransferase
MNKEKGPLNVLFMGTPDFSVPTLEALHHSPLVKLMGVVSMPDRPAGRGQQLQSPAVIQYAKAEKIPFFQSENINQDRALIEQVKEIKIDFILVLAFAQFLNKEWLALAPGNVFNIHTSLLPLYRGAAPIQAALLHGDTKTGVTIQRMVKKMDAGDIAYSSETPIAPDENCESLSTRLKLLAAVATLEFLEKLSLGTLSFQEQDHSLASFASTIKRDDGFLDFANSSAETLLRKLRAYDPWPGTFCFLNQKRIKVFSMETTTHGLAAGVVKLGPKRELYIGTQTDTLSLLSVQPEGKRKMIVRDYVVGLADEPPKLSPIDKES